VTAAALTRRPDEGPAMAPPGPERADAFIWWSVRDRVASALRRRGDVGDLPRALRSRVYRLCRAARLPGCAPPAFLRNSRPVGGRESRAAHYLKEFRANVEHRLDSKSTCGRQSRAIRPHRLGPAHHGFPRPAGHRQRWAITGWWAALNSEKPTAGCLPATVAPRTLFRPSPCREFPQESRRRASRHPSGTPELVNQRPESAR